MNDSVNLSSILSGMIDQIQQHSRLAIIYLAIMTPLAAASLYFEGQGGRASNFNFGLMIDEALLSQGAVAVIVVIGVFVVGLLAHYWLFAGMTRNTETPSFDRFWPYLGIYILSSFAIGLGFVALIIPGFILSVRWIALLPSVINRSEGAMDAFGENWEMTKGYGWSIFGAGLIIGVVLITVAIVIGIMAAFLGEASFIASFLAATLETVFTLVFVAFSVTVYHQLRDDKEELAGVFE